MKPKATAKILKNVLGTLLLLSAISAADAKSGTKTSTSGGTGTVTTLGISDPGII